MPFGEPGVEGGELSCKPRSELTGDSQSNEFGRELLEFIIMIFLTEQEISVSLAASA